VTEKNLEGSKRFEEVRWMPEYEVTFSQGRVSVTIKSSDPEFIEKWWKIVKPITVPDPVPYPEKKS
jgi:hypothetical protein